MNPATPRPDVDQSLAAVRDALPPLWYAVYRGCLITGFTADQAYQLTQVWILSQGRNGVLLPGNPDGQPKEDQ